MDENATVASCKEKLTRFRLKELKDVLSRLGLSKQGKKQELTDRILASLFQEQETDPRSSDSGNTSSSAARIIEEVYQNMHPDTSDAAAAPGLNKITRAKKENGEISSSDRKVRCPCGSSLYTNSMVKCVDGQCNVWQHIGCVIVPENVAEGNVPVIPPNFYCEMCRVAKADPFWVAVRYPLPPVIVDPCSPSAEGKPTRQIIGRGFQLSVKDRELLGKDGHELQVWSLLLNDNVPFRMHWPLFSEFHVNGKYMRVMPRPNQQPLGSNGRDDSPLIGAFCREASNKITLLREDSRKFCLAVRIARRRNLNEVLSMIPKEEEGENYEDALARVCRCVGGGTAAGNANDSDSDIELVADVVTVNLRCPMSGLRMKVAGRFKPCAHMGCFDLETLVSINERTRKWQCPICLKNYSLESLIIDPYFNRITSLMYECKEDISEIEIKADASWRVKTSNQFKNLEKWHLPDGTLCPLTTKPCFSLHTESEPKIEEMYIEDDDQRETKPSIDKLQQFESKVSRIESAVGNFGLNGQNSHAMERISEAELIVLSDSDDDDDHDDDEKVLDDISMINNGETIFTAAGPSCLELLNGSGEFDDISYWENENNSQQLFSEEVEQQHHQMQQNDVTVASLNGNGNGMNDYTDYSSFLNSKDRSDLMDLDSVNGVGLSGNLNDENGAVQPIIDAAAVLHGMNGGNNTNNNHPGQSRYTTFSPPRQHRSAKRRVILTIDSDSE